MRRRQPLQCAPARAECAEGALEPRTLHTHSALGLGHVGRGLAELGLEPPELLTVAEAARLLRFDAYAKDPEKAFRDFAAAHAVPAKRCGRRLLFERRVLLEHVLKTA